MDSTRPQVQSPEPKKKKSTNQNKVLIQLIQWQLCFPGQNTLKMPSFPKENTHNDEANTQYIVHYTYKTRLKDTKVPFKLQAVFLYKKAVNIMKNVSRCHSGFKLPQPSTKQALHCVLWMGSAGYSPRLNGNSSSTL